MTFWFMSEDDGGGGDGVCLTTVAKDGELDVLEVGLALAAFPFLGLGFVERVSDTMMNEMRKCIQLHNLLH